MSSNARSHSAFEYIKRKRIVRDSTKPTAVDRITSHRYINPQVASPLFALLPTELRLQIFKYALQSSSNTSKPYSKHSYWYRPGYTHASTIAISLLLTCRRIYLETDCLPVTLNEHVIWGVERSRIPPHTTNYLVDGSMKSFQRNAIQYVHLFAQQYWIEDWKYKWLGYAQSWPDGCPPKLRITIRHTDWWYNLLGENSPLALDPKKKGRAKAGNWVEEEEPFEPGSWGQRFSYMQGLKQFELELETVESKKGELDVIVDRAHTWKFTLRDGSVLVLDQKETKTDKWTGSKHFKGFNAPSVQPGLQLRQGSIASFTGSSTRRTSTEPEALEPGDVLDYYVVTLTWYAQAAPAKESSDSGKPNHVLPMLFGRGVNLSPTIVTFPRVSFNRMNAIPTSYG